MVFEDLPQDLVVKCVPPENFGTSLGWGTDEIVRERDNFVRTSPQDRKEQIVRPTRACAFRAQTIGTGWCAQTHR